MKRRKAGNLTLIGLLLAGGMSKTEWSWAYNPCENPVPPKECAKKALRFSDLRIWPAVRCSPPGSLISFAGYPIT